MREREGALAPISQGSVVLAMTAATAALVSLFRLLSSARYSEGVRRLQAKKISTAHVKKK
jgi:hypothetical protein